jgi:hypothetical protein
VHKEVFDVVAGVQMVKERLHRNSCSGEARRTSENPGIFSDDI